MPEDFDPVSADSQKFLEQVKKGKPRNFALVTKGVKVLALLVKKKPIKGSEAKELKKFAKGQKIFIGVVDGRGQDITFKLKSEDSDKPPGKELMLKDFLLSKAEFKCKPKYEIVQELDEVNDDAEVDETSSSTEESVEDPAVGLIANAMNELGSKVKEFVGVFVDRRVEILKPWKAMKDFHEGGGDATAAQEALEVVKNLLGGLENVPPEETAKSTGSVEQPSEEPTVDRAGQAEFTKRLSALAPKLKEALGSPSTDRDNLNVRRSEMETYARKKDFEQALAVLDDIETLIEKISTSKKAEEEWNKLYGQLEPRYETALKADPELANKMRVIMTYATEQAEAGSFPKAVTALGRLSPLLDEAESIEKPARPAGKIAPAIAFAQSRLRWDDAKNTIQAELTTLENAILEASSGEASNVFDAIRDKTKILYRVLGDHAQKLKDKLDDKLEARNEQEQQEAVTEALSLVAGYKKYVNEDTLVADIDDNPFHKVTVRKTLVATLDDLESKLAQ